MFPKSNSSNSSNSHMRRISDGGNNARFTLPPLKTSSSSSSIRHNNATSLPPLHFNNNNNDNISHSRYQPPTITTQPHTKNTYSYSYPSPQQQSTTTSIAESSSRNATTIKMEPSTHSNKNIQHEEYYYPVYNNNATTATKHEWSEDEAIIPTIVVENTKHKKKREMDERIKEIDREFLDNREVLYEEKIKQLQDELLAVEKGQHEIFDQNIADLEQKRRETIHDARLMMIYQISSVDKECNLTFKKVQDESLAEQKEIQNALFSMIEEKRKRLKEEKDGEFLEVGQQPHQTRNRQRLQRKKRGELENLVGSPHYHTPPTSSKKKAVDRQRGDKGEQSHLLGLTATTRSAEEEIEQDFYEMTRKRRF